MKTKKTINILAMLMLLQVAVSAQNIHFQYDASGNRVKRWISQPIAPPQNNPSANNNTAIADDVNSLTLALSKGEGTNSNSIQGGELASSKLLTSDIKVFPNPVQDKLNVQFTGSADAEGCSLQIYDGAGKLFSREAELKNNNEINMQQAKTGTYFLIIINKEGKRLYWKLVKE